MKSNIKLTVLYDNNRENEDLQIDWGFACLIEIGKFKILFDTGDNGAILLNNMKKLGVSPRSISILVLSHHHHDHTGGLMEFLKNNPNVEVFFPKSFPGEIINVIKKSGAAAIPVPDFYEILSDMYILGLHDSAIPEQCLVVRSERGLIIVTGCAHPGIITVLGKVKILFPNELVYLVIGGFHLHKLTEEEIAIIISKLFRTNVLSIAPTHCTGNPARRIFKEVFGDKYIECGAGKTIILD
jgi:7,8-dihydropterin-6-yl-methyl-4-(beta-D-ribofuranosyl)aminobenzene 5'-phosphate synthase